MDALAWKDVALAACGLLSLGAVGISGWALLMIVAYGNRLTAVETEAKGISRRIDEVLEQMKEIRRILESR